jgi:CubicO group peptidase (beta-lactamase class C family)
MFRIRQFSVLPRAIALSFLSLRDSAQMRSRVHARRAFGPIVCILCLAAILPAWPQSLETVKPEQVGLSSERLERIGKVFNREIDQGKLPGAVVLVARKGRVAYFESFGFRDKAAGTPMTKDSLFEIYSMTKPLVSVAAMMLVEEGRLQLADPVAKFLPEFANLQVSVPKFDTATGKLTYGLASLDRPMTVQDLLRHTSGLVYGDSTADSQVKDAYLKAGILKLNDATYDLRDLTPDDEIARLSKLPLAHQPGTTWEYSVSVDVLGRVIEKVSGERLSDFLDERLFKPLKMVDTGFFVPKPNIDRLAQPLSTDPTTGAPVKLHDVSTRPANDSGGAGGVSTAGDYLRFAQMMLNGGWLDDAQILSRTTVSLMTADHLGPQMVRAMQPSEVTMGSPGYTFGLGFAVRPEPGIVAFPGSQGDYMWAGFAGTYFWIDPKEDLIGILMTQAPGPTRQYYRREIRQLVYQAVTDRPSSAGTLSSSSQP